MLAKLFNLRSHSGKRQLFVFNITVHSIVHLPKDLRGCPVHVEWKCGRKHHGFSKSAIVSRQDTAVIDYSVSFECHLRENGGSSSSSTAKNSAKKRQSDSAILMKEFVKKKLKMYLVADGANSRRIASGKFNLAEVSTRLRKETFETHILTLEFLKGAGRKDGNTTAQVKFALSSRWKPASAVPGTADNEEDDESSDEEEEDVIVAESPNAQQHPNPGRLASNASSTVSSSSDARSVASAPATILRVTPASPGSSVSRRSTARTVDDSDAALLRSLDIPRLSNVPGSSLSIKRRSTSQTLDDEQKAAAIALEESREMAEKRRLQRLDEENRVLDACIYLTEPEYANGVPVSSVVLYRAMEYYDNAVIQNASPKERPQRPANPHRHSRSKSGSGLLFTSMESVSWNNTDATFASMVFSAMRIASSQQCTDPYKLCHLLSTCAHLWNIFAHEKGPTVSMYSSCFLADGILSPQAKRRPTADRAYWLSDFASTTSLILTHLLTLCVEEIRPFVVADLIADPTLLATGSYQFLDHLPNNSSNSNNNNSTSSNNVSTSSRILSVLSRFRDDLEENFVPIVLTRLFFKHVFRFIDAVAFNTLVAPEIYLSAPSQQASNKYSLCMSVALQVKMSVGELEEWLRLSVPSDPAWQTQSSSVNNNSPTESSATTASPHASNSPSVPLDAAEHQPALVHLREMCDLCVLPKESLLDQEAHQRVAPHLSRKQVIAVLQHYHEDELDSSRVKSDLIKRIDSVLAKEEQQRPALPAPLKAWSDSLDAESGEMSASGAHSHEDLVVLAERVPVSIKHWLQATRATKFLALPRQDGSSGSVGPRSFRLELWRCAPVPFLLRDPERFPFLLQMTGPAVRS